MTRRANSSTAIARRKPPHEEGSPYYFDTEEADLAVEFIENFCCHVKGEWAGTPLLLEPWEKDIVRTTFGWKRKADGTRRYRLVFIEIPRKNGKSLLGAAFSLLLLFADGEKGAEVYSAAADREQAALIFDVAKQMVQQSQDLSQRCDVFRRSLFVAETMSVYKVLSADVETKHGLNPSGIIFDELHTQPHRHLWDVLQTGTAARQQPLTVVLTTAGLAGEPSIYNELHDHAEAVLKGVVQDDSFLPIIFAIDKDKGEKWSDQDVWRRVNPNLGISVKWSYLIEQFNKAKLSPAYENTFRRLHLNERVNQIERWIVMEQWDACAGDLSFAELEEQLEGEACVLGLDLSTTKDLSACVAVFPRSAMPGEPGYPTERELLGKDAKRIVAGFEYGDPYEWVDVLAYLFCPEEGIRIRGERDRVPYQQWAKEGFLKATPGNAVDHQAIRLFIREELAKRFYIREICADPAQGHKLLTELANDDGFLVVQLRQGFLSLNAPTKYLDTLYIEGKIRHAGHPVLRWCANNAALETDSVENWKPSKKRSTERIDGIAALINGLARLLVDSEDRDYDRPIQIVGRE